jgi:archaellum component FlaC
MNYLIVLIQRLILKSQQKVIEAMTTVIENKVAESQEVILAASKAENAQVLAKLDAVQQEIADLKTVVEKLRNDSIPIDEAIAAIDAVVATAKSSIPAIYEPTE